MAQNKTIANILRTIHESNPEELGAAYDQGKEMSDKEPGNPVTDSIFEVDGQLYKVPLDHLRRYLGGEDVGSLESEMAKKFTPTLPKARNRIPDNLGTSPKMNAEDSSEHDLGYYWDKPEVQYNDMNPEAIKARVLSKKIGK